LKLITIVGARPQFIKAAAVSRILRAQTDVLEKIIHTGQHFDANMSDVFFEEMEIPRPDYFLEVHSLPHGAMTGRMLEGIEEVLIREQPDAVLVFGDTNSTLAGALAASKLHIKVVHVEAGLRSYNMAMPEEINRILTDRLSNVLYCPTEAAISNLEKEGFRNFDCELILCGDVMEDAALYYAPIANKRSSILEEVALERNSFILCTIHRQENTDIPDRMAAIITALNAVHKDVQVVMPVHPRTRKFIESQAMDLNITLLPPVGYFDMLTLLQHAQMVITDSGGLQKEAYFFDKFCLTLRDETEWVELVDGGFNRLVGADPIKIKEGISFFSGKEFHKGSSLYGGGHAAERIVQHLTSLK